MKNGKWANLFGTVLASGTLITVLTSGNKIAKKYGEKPFNSKLVDLNFTKTVEYAIDKFANTDDEKIIALKNIIK